MSDSMALLSGYVSRAAVQWFLLWGFAYLEGPTGAGDISFALAVTAPAFIFFEMGLRNVYVTQRIRPSFVHFVLVRLGLISVLSCVLVATAGLMNLGAAGVIVAVVGVKFCDSALDIFLADLQDRHLVRRLAMVVWVNSAATFVLAGVCVFLLRDALAAVWASAVISLTTTLLFGGPVLRREWAGFWGLQQRSFIAIATAGAPLAVAQSSVSLISYLPILYLSMAADRAVVGVFAAAYYAVTLANIFFNSVQQTWLRSLADAYSSGGVETLVRAAGRVGIGLAAVGSLGAVCVLAFLPSALPVIYGDAFRLSRGEAAILAGAVLLLAGAYTTSALLMVLNEYSQQMVVAISALAASVCLMVVLNALEGGAVVNAGILVVAGAGFRTVFGLISARRAVSKA